MRYYSDDALEARVGQSPRRPHCIHCGPHAWLCRHWVLESLRVWLLRGRCVLTLVPPQDSKSETRETSNMGCNDSKMIRTGTGVKEDVEVLKLGAGSTVTLLGVSGMWERANRESESSFAVERHFSDWVDRPFMRFYKEYDNMTYTLDLRATHSYASIEGWWNDGMRVKSAGPVTAGSWTRNQYYADTDVEYTVKGRSLCRRSKYRAYGANAPVVTSVYTLSGDGSRLTHVRSVTRNGETGSYTEVFERKESYEETRARVGGTKDPEVVIEGLGVDSVAVDGVGASDSKVPAPRARDPAARAPEKLGDLERRLEKAESERRAAQAEAEELKRSMSKLMERLSAVESRVA